MADEEYHILRKLDHVELRKYPDLIFASVDLSHEERWQYHAFKILSNYIFGSNHGNRHIEMTAPVIVYLDEDKFKMSFIMPKKYKNNLPKPKFEAIHFEALKPRILAVFRFSGFAGRNKVEKIKNMLLNSLIKNKIPIKGKPFLMLYNSPWTLPFLKRNELAIEVLLS